MFSMVPYPRRNNGVSRKDDFFGLDRVFDEFFKDPFFARVSAITSPIRADIKENEKEYVVEAEIPGVKKEDILIDLNDDVLTLGVDIKQEKDEENDGYIYRERSSGSFKRSFHVQNIKNEDVKATYKDGVLTVVLPKAEPGTRSRKVSIE